MGFASAREVRAGKYIEVRVDEETLEAAEVQVGEMCRKLLANPVIESFSFEVLEG